MSSAYADVHSQYSLDQTLYTQKVYPAVKVVYPLTPILLPVLLRYSSRPLVDLLL
jgi:hypothetical protein